MIRVWRVELIENSTTRRVGCIARVAEPAESSSILSGENPSLHRLHRHRVFSRRSGGATSRACNISGSPDSSPSSTGALVIPLGRGRYRIILGLPFFTRDLSSQSLRGLASAVVTSAVVVEYLGTGGTHSPDGRERARERERACVIFSRVAAFIALHYKIAAGPWGKRGLK